MSLSSQVVVVGTLNIDHVWHVAHLPRPGETVLADRVERQFGGKGANQAVAAARQGARVSLFGTVGDEPDGASYRNHLQRESIDTTHIYATRTAATGAAHVYVDPHGENLIVVDRGANARVDVSALPSVLRRGDVVLTQLECELDAVVATLRAAAAAGARSILNASPTCREFLWTAAPIDVVVVNEHECLEWFALSAEELFALTEIELRSLLRVRNARHLVVTQGARPTLLVSAERRERVPVLAVTPRDTVGAGDTFTGTLAAELARDADWAIALRRANVAAALSTLAVGAQTAMPTRDQVDAAWWS